MIEECAHKTIVKDHSEEHSSTADQNLFTEKQNRNRTASSKQKHKGGCGEEQLNGERVTREELRG